MTDDDWRAVPRPDSQGGDKRVNGLKHVQQFSFHWFGNVNRVQRNLIGIERVPSHLFGSLQAILFQVSDVCLREILRFRDEEDSRLPKRPLSVMAFQTLPSVCRLADVNNPLHFVSALAEQEIDA